MLRRIAGLVAAALACALAAAPPALGHAAFLEASPVPGASVRTPPEEIVLEFTEPLNRKLSDAEINDGDVAADVLVRDGNRLVVRPRNPLPRAAYRVRWHTVSTEDGHALEGSFGFGVGVPAAGGSEQLEQSPLARGGWARALARFVFYASLLFFAGGVFCAAAFGRQWLGERAWRRTVDAGALATAAAVVVALAEGADAGGLNASELSEFLLTNTAGLGRVAAVLLVAAATALALRSTGAAAVAAGLAFLALALSGHAYSADPRVPAVVTDWLHLLAGAVWAGGIAQLALARAWHEAARFGRLALPAFLAVSASGIANAVIELGNVGSLFDTGYGLVLLAKVALVALVGIGSYLHLYRDKPTLRAQPVLLTGVVAAAALLVLFPLPPRQLPDADGARAAEPACDPCPLPKPAAGELALAEPAGTHVAALHLRRDGSGELRVLDRRGRAVDTEVDLDGARGSCGPGCTRFRAAPGAPVAARVAGRPVQFPGRWAGGGRDLLERAQREMRSLRSVRQDELTSSGPGENARVRYRLEAPDRIAWETDQGVRVVVIGDTQWMSVAGSPWQRGPYSGGGRFRFRSWFRWTAYARTVRTLERDGPVAELALFDEATPAWYRLRIDTRTLRVLESRAVAPARFITDGFSDFDQPLRIEPPRGAAP